MIDRLEKILNCNQSFRDNIDVFKEAFIKFYGEKYRDEIEEKFSKVLLIGFLKTEDMSSILRQMSQTVTKDLIDELLDGVKSISQEDLISGDDLEYDISWPIRQYQEFYDAYCLGEEGRLEAFYDKGYEKINRYFKDLSPELYRNIVTSGVMPKQYEQFPMFLKNLWQYYSDNSSCQEEYLHLFEQSLPLILKVDSSVNKDNFLEKLSENQFDEINKLAIKYKDIKHSFLKFKEKFSSYFTCVDKSLDNRSHLRTFYYAKLLEENIDFIPMEKRDSVDVFLKDYSKEYNLDSWVKKLFGSSLQSTNLIESFSSSKDDTINNPNTMEWIVSEIKRQRVEFFQLYGLDYGSDYEDYLDKEDVQKVWPERERVDRFIQFKNRLINEFNIKCFESFETNKAIREEIDSKKLLDKNDGFDVSTYENGVTCLSPNLVQKADGYDLFSLLLVHFSSFDKFIDHNIVHELNHLFELSLVDVADDSYSILCGWDKSVENITEQKEVNTLCNREKRSYELFNEIINELITQEICQIIRDDDVYVFDDMNDSSIKNCTSYEHSLFLVKDFYNEYKNSIIESRRNGNIDIIFNQVGQENFNALNDLFPIYYENFGGFKIYDLYDSLKNNKDTEQVRLYHSLVLEKDKIMNNMRSYGQNSNLNRNDINKSL